MSRCILTLIMEMENESLENGFSLQRGQFPLCFFVLPAMFVQEWYWVVDGEILAKLLTWWIYVNLLDIPWTKVLTKISNDSPKNLHSEQFAPIPSPPQLANQKQKPDSTCLRKFLHFGRLCGHQRHDRGSSRSGHGPTDPLKQNLR